MDGCFGEDITLRYVIFASVFLCSYAYAQSYSPASHPVSGPPALIPIQGDPDKLNVWRSPSDSLPQFPFLSPKECAQFGRAVGFPECTATLTSPEKARKAPEANRPPVRNDAARKPTARARAETERDSVSSAPLPEQRALALQDDGGTTADIRENPVASDTGLTGAKDAGLRDAVSRLLIITFEGRVPSDAGVQSAGKALKSGAVAGVLIRSKNIENTPQLRQLTASLNAPGAVPTILMIESPGGAERALAQASGLEEIPAPREVAAIGDPLGAFEFYRDMASGLFALGITMTLGPSAEICPQDAAAEISDCFGPEPIEAGALATAFNLADQEGHILTSMRYTLSSGERPNLEALHEILRHKAPDALVLRSRGPEAVSAEATARFVGSLREAGFTGPIILDRSTAPAGKSSLADALAIGADMIISGAGDGRGADATTMAVEDIRSALDSGQLARSRLDQAGKRAGDLIARLKAWSPNAVSQSENTVSSIRYGVPR